MFRYRSTMDRTTVTMDHTTVYNYAYQELMSRQRRRRSMKLSSMTIQITSRHLKIRRRNSRILCNRDVIIIITLSMHVRNLGDGDAYNIGAVALRFGVTWSRRHACLLDLLEVPSSSLFNLTSLKVRPSNYSKQPFRRARFDGEHRNPGACSHL